MAVYFFLFLSLADKIRLLNNYWSFIQFHLKFRYALGL